LGFDEQLSSPARLAIIACLVPGGQLTFSELKETSGLADGNLHVQARKLATAGYIEIIKGRRGGRSVTRFRITELGLESLRLHVRKLNSILATETGAIRPRVAAGRDDDSQVWS
jgi:DNA-binding MarR family transcriptional regulator